MNGSPNTWTYDGERMQVVIETAALSTASSVTVDVTVFDPSVESVLYGLAGKVRVSRCAIMCCCFNKRIVSSCEPRETDLGYELVDSWRANCADSSSQPGRVLAYSSRIFG